jgi:hypothetical protein
MTLGLSIAAWFGTPARARARAKWGLEEETINVADGK